jgi:hypothetical protein
VSDIAALHLALTIRTGGLKKGICKFVWDPRAAIMRGLLKVVA